MRVYLSMDTTRIFFFDSHGGLWVTCAGDELGARAFGPRHTAREASAAELGVEVPPGATIYRAAEDAKLIFHGGDGWTYARRPR